MQGNESNNVLHKHEIKLGRCRFYLRIILCLLKTIQLSLHYPSKHFKSVVQIFKIIMVAHFTQFPSYNYCLFYSNFIYPCKNRIYG